MIRFKNYKKYIKRIFLSGVIVFILGICLTAYSNIYILKQADGYLYQTINGLPHAQAVMILGARVYNNGQMSDMFRDRVDTAIQVYQAGIVSKILVSGDHGTHGYDEVNTAREYLLTKGIPAEDIFLDHAGFDTYDSMYRARDIFDVETLIISTQDFHLTRAVYLARALGIEAYGISADRRSYVAIKRNQLREILARFKAFLNIVFHSGPRYLGAPIPITGEGRTSWDVDK